MKEWLRNKPKEVDIDHRFFGVLDKKAKEDKPKVVLCRIGDKEGRGEHVECVLNDAETSSLTLAGLDYGRFDQLIEGRGMYTPDI